MITMREKLYNIRFVVEIKEKSEMMSSALPDIIDMLRKYWEIHTYNPILIVAFNFEDHFSLSPFLYLFYIECVGS